MTYFVEINRPAYPLGDGPEFFVHKAKDFSRDVLSPTMTCVFRVEHVKNRNQALALCIEKLAGKGVCCSQVF